MQRRTDVVEGSRYRKVHARRPTEALEGHLYLLLITYYLLLITYHLLLITYNLLLITYYLLLITYHIIYSPNNGGKLHCTFPVKVVVVVVVEAVVVVVYV